MAAHAQLVRNWETFYNENATRMVNECYAPDCDVRAMGLDGVIRGREMLQKVEDAVLAKAPKRRLEVTGTVESGDVVCVECVLRDPDRGADWALPFIAVLTIKDGLVVKDRTYADWKQWPGF